MDDMRIVFLVVGTISIVGLMMHGFWSVQKKKPKTQNRRTGTTKSKKAIPRVAPEPLIEEPESAPISALEPKVAETQPSQPSLLVEDNAPIPAPQVKASRPRSVSRKEPSLGHDQIELGFDITAETEQVAGEVNAVTPEPAAEPASVEPTPAFNTEPESELDERPLPKFELRTEEQDTFDLPSQDPVTELAPEPEEREPQTQPDAEASEPKPQDPTDVLVLYVVGKDGSQILGEELLPNLTSMGFKFGDMQIFHRHQHTAGRGPVLYSLANMLQPGTFDLDTMEQFSTEGVLLFLTLPTSNDARVAFSMMLGNAQGLADVHGGQVLDDQREPWSEAAQERYMQRLQKAESTTQA